MIICRTYDSLRLSINDLRHQGKSIGFVPTMGALHAGHMSLVELAKTHADSMICSIFVNPTQFAEGEDLEHYPRPEADDLALLEEHEVDIVYLPSVKDIYSDENEPEDSDNFLCDILEGEFRPHFFYGVKNVVTKLLHQTSSDVAVFGEKDYQQLLVIKHLVESLSLGVKIVSSPTYREDDGLAFSSRNVYLSDEQRHIAPALYDTISQIATRYHEVEDKTVLLKWGRKCILDAGFDSIDYLEIRDSSTLSEDIHTSARILVAATLGKTRLIDNVGREYV